MSEVDKHLHPENATASSSSLSPICAQFPELKGLMEGNRIWAKGCKEEMPDLLPKLATGQVCLLLIILLPKIVPLACIRKEGVGRVVIDVQKSRADNRHPRSSGLDVSTPESQRH